MRKFGQWGLALAGKSRGEDAGGWFDSPVGDDDDPKSVSHEHTFDEDTAEADKLQSTLVHLIEMVARRLREGGYFARTVQLKLRYKDFTTITRAQSLEQPTQMDQEIFEQARRLFFATGKRARRCGCWECRRQISNRVPLSLICWSLRGMSVGRRLSRPRIICATSLGNRRSASPGG